MKTFIRRNYKEFRSYARMLKGSLIITTEIKAHRRWITQKLRVLYGLNFKLFFHWSYARHNTSSSHRPQICGYNGYRIFYYLKVQYFYRMEKWRQDEIILRRPDRTVKLRIGAWEKQHRNEYQNSERKLVINNGSPSGLLHYTRLNEEVNENIFRRPNETLACSKAFRGDTQHIHLS